MKGKNMNLSILTDAQLRHIVLDVMPETVEGCLRDTWRLQDEMQANSAYPDRPICRTCDSIRYSVD